MSNQNHKTKLEKGFTFDENHDLIENHHSLRWGKQQHASCLGSWKSHSPLQICVALHVAKAGPQLDWVSWLSWASAGEMVLEWGQRLPWKQRNSPFSCIVFSLAAADSLRALFCNSGPMQRPSTPAKTENISWHESKSFNLDQIFHSSAVQQTSQ